MERKDLDQFIAAVANADFSAAAKAVNNLLQTTPTSVVHLCNRAFCHLKLDFYRKCIKDCDDALAIDATYGIAYLRKGEALLKMGKTADAKYVFELGLAKADADVDVLLLLQKGAKGEDISKIASAPLAAASPASTPSITQNGSATNEDQVSSALDEALKQQLDQSQVDALAQVAAKGLVQNGVGNANIDQRIAFGNLQVNTGKYPQGIKVFSELITAHPDLVAAYLGRGTALAMTGLLQDAYKDFAVAIKLNPTNLDALKRRAQVLSALGREQEALSDLTTAVDLSKDADSYHQRGLSYHKLRNYKRALDDFSKSAKLEHANKATYNYMGLCHICLGQPKEALENYRKALALDPNYKEALANMGQTYKEMAKEADAFKSFNLAMKADSTYAHGYYLRGLAWFGVGLHRQAYNDFTNALKIDQSLFEAWWMRGVCASDLGMEISSTGDYDRALQLRPEHASWYQRQLSLFFHHRLDTPLISYNLDSALDPEFKEWWCKRNPPKPQLVKQPPVTKSIADIDPAAPAPAWLSEPRIRELLAYCDSIGKWVHQDAPGFLKNRRQIAMAGLAAVEIAQTLRRVWDLAPLPASAAQSSQPYSHSHGKGGGKKAGNKHTGATSSNSTSSSSNYAHLDGKASSSTGAHEFGWRDMYDIVVKWRQYSEPNDPVYWVDKLPPEQFQEGFGSHTPIFTGQCKVIRYGRMFERSLPIMKELMKQQHVLNSEQLDALYKADSPESLYKIIGHDFFVVTPCHSVASPKKIMEGTRLTIQNSPPEGWEYSIRTPGTPPRWVDYDIELTHLFSSLSEEAKKPTPDDNKMLNIILTIGFYWYNFMPLARGTAICGYVSILAMSLAIGKQIKAPIPSNVLLDWDAILLPTPEQFINTCTWLTPHRESIDTSQFDALALVRDSFPTLRHLFTVLNHLCKE